MKSFDKQNGRLSWMLEVADRVNSMSCLNYTLAEKAGLILTHRKRGNHAKLLDFQVTYPNLHAFRLLLSEIFFKGEYRFDARTEVPVILDCGANIGLATLFFKSVYPHAKISAFEADPETAAILRRNVEQNHLQDVSVYNLMLSGTEGEGSFYVSKDLAASPLMSAVPDRSQDTREIRVRAARLSDFVNGSVDLLKLDVEGSEFDVLNDLTRSGKISLIKRMVIEYHHKIGKQSSRLAKFLAILEDAGFEYQVSATCDPITRENFCQDILLGVYRAAD